MTERRSFSYRVIFAGLFATLLLAAGAGLYIYFAYVKYERVAARHLPAGTTAALRLDLEKVVLFEPVRKHLLPLALERRAESRSQASRDDSRLERFQRATGIELAVDTREFVAGIGRSPTEWVLVVGGRFPREGVLDGVERMLTEDGFAWRRSTDRTALLAPNGIALGQAADGSLILAANETLLRASLPNTGVAGQLGLPAEGPGGFAVVGERVRELVPGALRTLVPPLRVVEDIQHIQGEATLGSEVTVTTFVRVGAGGAQQAAEQLQTLSSGIRRMPMLPVGSGVLRHAERLHSAVESPDTVRVTTEWTREEVDRAVGALAGALRTLFGWS